MSGVCLLGEDGGPVIVFEGSLYAVRVVHEVQHEDAVLVGSGPVEPGNGLDRLDTPQCLVALMLMGLWWIVTLVGLDESHPVIAEVIVYVALILIMAALIVAGLMKGKVSVEPR